MAMVRAALLLSLLFAVAVRAEVRDCDKFPEFLQTEYVDPSENGGNGGSLRVRGDPGTDDFFNEEPPYKCSVLVDMEMGYTNFDEDSANKNCLAPQEAFQTQWPDLYPRYEVGGLGPNNFQGELAVGLIKDLDFDGDIENLTDCMDVVESLIRNGAFVNADAPTCGDVCSVPVFSIDLGEQVACLLDSTATANLEDGFYRAGDSCMFTTWGGELVEVPAKIGVIMMQDTADDDRPWLAEWSSKNTTRVEECSNGAALRTTCDISVTFEDDSDGGCPLDNAFPFASDRVATLGALRRFRDTRMSPVLVSAYYSLVRAMNLKFLARHFAVVRFVLRNGARAFVKIAL